MKRRVTLKGGLGDILMAMQSSDLFGAIDALSPQDELQIMIISHCRGIGEMFDRHPKRRQLDIVDHEFVDPMTTDVYLPYGGQLPDQRLPGRMRVIPRYLSDSDKTLIESIRGKFVAFSLASGFDNRNVPIEIATEAAKTCMEAGFTVVLLGRNYESWHRWGAVRWQGQRSEPVVELEGVVNAIDVLTLPGSLEVVARSSGVFCSLSAFQLAAWLLGKRRFVVTGKQFAPAIDMINKYQIGPIRYSDGNAEVSYAEAWEAQKFSEFVRRLA